MKIGVLTFHRPCNFGANLQAYSTFRYLSSLGHDVKVIDYIREVDTAYHNKVKENQFEAHQEFVQTHLPLTRKVTSDVELQELVSSEKFHLIVIGSDAVWRELKDKDQYTFFAKWLFDNPIISGIPVVSLSAAHMGNGFASFSNEQIKEIRACLDKFAYITTRDEYTRSIINGRIYGGEERVDSVNPDPVFNLSRYVDNEKWLNHDLNSKQYYLMTLPKNWAQNGITGKLRRLWFSLFSRIVHKNGYKTVELPTPEGVSGLKFDLTLQYPIDPIQWFLWIKNAKAFCGIRFHSIVSSISCGTPFFSLDTYGGASLKYFLLTRLGLYDYAFKEDTKSKIYRLLKGSSFEHNRISSYLENISPRRLFVLLDHTNENEILKFRDSQIKKFDANLKRMLAIADGNKRAIEKLRDDCTGCFACMNVCPVDAVSLPENEEGFYYPHIDYNICINCGRCDGVCPQLHPGKRNARMKSYYGFSNDEKLRISSSSGGVFSLISDSVINDAGVIYGAAFDFKPELKLCTKSTKEISLEKLRKSKYVQSYVGLSFRSIKNDLKDGRKVFFCGTPCQVDGLLHYLGKDYDGLLTADFICHGVPPMSLLRTHLVNKKIKDVVAVDFRPKTREWVDDIVVLYNSGKKRYCSPWSFDTYFWLFQKYKSLRRSCYSCKYCNGHRASDITLADFWGYRAYDPSIYNKKGVSLILTNTTKGEEVISGLIESEAITIKRIEDRFSEYVYTKKRTAPNSGYSLKERNKFYNDYLNYGLEEAMEINGYTFPLYKRIKNTAKNVLRSLKR